MSACPRAARNRPRRRQARPTGPQGQPRREPGARLVFTVGWRDRPRATARFASRPAATITEGFEVLVQLVMAAIATEPLVKYACVLPIVTSTSLVCPFCLLPPG